VVSCKMIIDEEMETTDALKDKTPKEESREEQFWPHDEQVAREPSETVPRAELSRGYIQHERRQNPDDTVCQWNPAVIDSRSVERHVLCNQDVRPDTLTALTSSQFEAPAHQQSSCTLMQTTMRRKARLQLIQKLRCLQTRRQETTTAQVNADPIIVIVSSHRPAPTSNLHDPTSTKMNRRKDVACSERKGLIPNPTRPVMPSTTMAVLPASHDSEAAFAERNRANKLLVELAKTKAEVLTLRYRLAATEKANQASQEELSRFKRLDHNKNRSHPAAQATESKLISAWTSLWQHKHETDPPAQGPPARNALTNTRLDLCKQLRKAVTTNLSRHRTVTQGLTEISRWVLRQEPRRKVTIPAITGATINDTPENEGAR
jgi:hypothetical protein